MLNGKVKVKIHLRAGLSHIKEEAHRVNGDFFKQINKGYSLARAFAHTDNLSVPRETDELHKNYVKVIAAATDSVKRALHSCHMTVVVGSPYIDCLFKASYLELIAVIGDIGGKISGIAVGSDENLIF